jgi:hypothetical protein
LYISYVLLGRFLFFNKILLTYQKIKIKINKEKVLASMYSTKPYIFDLSVRANRGENLASVLGYWPISATETRYLVFFFFFF